MICRDKVIFSCLIAAGLGAAGGYIFSSKFCAVTIVNRVGNVISSQQTLRDLFSETVCASNNLIRSIFFNLPDSQTQSDHYSEIQNKIVELLRSFYGNNASLTIRNLFERNKELITQLASQARDKQPLRQTTDELGKNYDEITKTINNLNNNATNSTVSMTEVPFLITQQIIALQNNNWKNAIEFYNQQQASMEKIADQINQAITQQFPQKI